MVARKSRAGMEAASRTAQKRSRRKKMAPIGNIHLLGGGVQGTEEDRSREYAKELSSPRKGSQAIGRWIFARPGFGRTLGALVISVPDRALPSHGRRREPAKLPGRATARETRLSAVTRLDQAPERRTAA